VSGQLSQRARSVLSRFPAHLDVVRPEKQIANVVEGLGGDFETFASQLAGVRTAHRLSQAPTIRDLLLLGAIHGVTDADLGLVTVRTEKLRAMIDELRQLVPAGGDPMRASATRLLDAFAIAGADERLIALAPAAVAGTPPDEQGAANALIAAASEHVGFDATLEAIRRRLADICALHADGNGTVRALLRSTLSALDLEADGATNDDVRARLVAAGRGAELDLRLPDEFFHSADHFWHSTFVRDSVPLVAGIVVNTPAPKVLMGATIALAVLSQRSGIGVARLIDRARAAGHADATPATRIPFDEADDIAAAEHFTIERVRRGTLALTGSIAMDALAIKLGGPVEAVQRAVETLAGGSPAPATLSPQTAAIVARKYGYDLTLQPARRLAPLGIEENPLQRERRDPVSVTHGQTFTIRRRGFGREPLRVEIQGVDDLTMGPMLVNRDEGRGVGIFGPVPNGSTLMFTEEGLVFLDGGDISTIAYSWQGACFADSAPHARDFVFDGPGVSPKFRATFAEAIPADALDREAFVPHASEFLTPPGINVGETRFAFFVQQTHLGFRATPNDVTPTPHTVIGFADSSVFAGGDDERDPKAPNPNDPVAAKVTLSWLEHEGYAVRVIVPARFRFLSGDGPAVETRIASALERVRPAGVEVRVEFSDDRWTLGQGSVTDEQPLDDNPNNLLRGGTALWSPGDLT
jgi:hypothetical protein